MILALVCTLAVAATTAPDAGVQIDVLVKDVTGKPLVSVVALSAGDVPVPDVAEHMNDPLAPFDRLSDDKGIAVITGLRPGTYTVWATDSVNGTARAVVKAPGRVTLVPQSGRVDGFVRDPNGKALAHAIVTVRRGETTTTLATDENGHYVLPLAKGKVTVFATAHGAHASGKPADATIGETGVTTLSLTAPPAAKIHGTVVRPDGKPAAGAEVIENPANAPMCLIVLAKTPEMRRMKASLMMDGKGSPTVIADKKGEFEIDADSMCLCAHLGNTVTPDFVIANTMQTVKLVLQPAP